MRSARMTVTQVQPKKDTNFGKRSRQVVNYIAEGQENEEPALKKRVSPVNTEEIIAYESSYASKNSYHVNSSLPAALEQQNASSNSVSIVSTESLKSSQRLTLEVPDVALMPSMSVPKSWYATNDINWAPEDDDTYAWFIFDRKLKEESQFVLNEPVFENIQHVVTPTSHNCMFNFLCEVSQEQRLSYATFLHAMHIFDFALSRMPIGRNDFLMAGCASLMLAAKLEEIYPPTSDALMSHANFVFSRSELFRCERVLMETLKFHIALPTRLQFAEYLGKMQKISKRQGILLQYLVGLSMLDFDLNYYKNSVVAAAALVVTFQLTNPSRDTATFVFHVSQIIACAVGDIHTCVVHIRYLHFIAQTGPDTHPTVLLPCMKRTQNNNNNSNNNNNNNNKPNFHSLKPLSTQLCDWFNSDEAMNVVEVTALPLHGLDLSLLVNKSVNKSVNNNITLDQPARHRHTLPDAQKCRYDYVDFTNDRILQATLNAFLEQQLKRAQEKYPHQEAWWVLMICKVKTFLRYPAAVFSPEDRKVVSEFLVACTAVVLFEEKKQIDEEMKRLSPSCNFVIASEHFQRTFKEVQVTVTRLAATVGVPLVNDQNNSNNSNNNNNHNDKNNKINNNQNNKTNSNNNNNNSRYNIARYYNKTNKVPGTATAAVAVDPNAIAMAAQLGIGL